MLTALIALGIFGTVLVFLQGCAAVHRLMKPRGADRAVERVQKWSAPTAATELEIIRKESLSDIPWLNDVLMKVRRVQPLRVLHRQADCRVPLGTFVLGTPVVALVGFMTAWSMRLPVLLALLFAVGCGALPTAYLAWLKRQRLAMFERQLPEALELVSRALRAGHAFSVGLNLVGEEASDPIGMRWPLSQRRAEPKAACLPPGRLQPAVRVRQRGPAPRAVHCRSCLWRHAVPRQYLA